MYAAVVHDVGLDHLVAVGLQDLRQGVAQQIVAHMSQMQRLVGVGAGVLHHHQRTVLVSLDNAVIRVVGDGLEHVEPIMLADHYIEEALDHVELLDSGHILFQPLSDFLRSGLRSLVRCLQVREHHQRQVSLELLARRVQLDGFRIRFQSVQGLQRLGHSFLDYFLDCHYYYSLIFYSLLLLLCRNQLKCKFSIFRVIGQQFGT